MYTAQKVWLLLPLAIAIVACDGKNTPKQAQPEPLPTDTIQTVQFHEEEGIQKETTYGDKTPAQIGEGAYLYADVAPQFPGGPQALQQFVRQHLHRPAEGKSGEVVVAFIVDTDGSLHGFHVVKSMGMAYDDEAILVAKAMPKWSPGIKNGEKVKVNATMTVNY